MADADVVSFRNAFADARAGTYNLPDTSPTKADLSYQAKRDREEAEEWLDGSGGDGSTDGQAERRNSKQSLERNQQLSRNNVVTALATRGSTSESRHEYFPFPSLDLSVALSLAASTRDAPARD